MQLSTFSVILSLLVPDIFLNTLFSNTINLCSSLNVRDQVLQPYNMTGNIMVLYVLTFNFLESRQDDKIFSSEYKHAFSLFILHLISL